MDPILQTSPQASYVSHRAEIEASLHRVLNSGCYILGEEVASFENEFAKHMSVSYAIGVASGTAAVELALRACEVGSGDLVFTVAHTAVATVAAIELCGATPVLLDVDPASYTMDAECLRNALRDHPPGKPRAVVPVHLYGHPSEMKAIKQVAEENGLYIIEDCAQAHGARLDGRFVGSWGHIAAFSFYPTKNLGALGDGGAVVTSDLKLAERVRLLREYGWRDNRISEVPGGNSRLDPIQAAILRVKLAYLKSENRQRVAHAEHYRELLQSDRIKLPETSLGAQHVYHQFVIRTPQRNDLSRYLRNRGVGTAIHYPVPIHRHPAYAGRLPTSGPLPQTDAASREILSLPMYPQLRDDEVITVARHILAWIDRQS